ncbi:MAG: polysaccharide deacetylase family protein, partial [Holophagaceae bacterium]
ARARAETFLPSAPVPPLAARTPQTLPRTDQAPPTKPTPALPPARARAETYLPSAPIPALPERKPLALTRTDQPPPPRSAIPTLPAWAQIETSLPSTHLTPLAGRRVAAAGAPEMAPTPRRSTAAPNLLETLPARPPQTPLPLQTQVPAWPGAGEALNLTRGPAGRKRLLLSFDGGSNAEVATQILDLLRARKVRSTFFLTGAFIQHHPALVRRMAAEGHELGNHTLSHPHFAPGMKRDPKWTRERFQQQLLDADMALLRLLGRPMDPLWRAPYGEHTAELRRWAEEVGYRHVGWSEGADTLDWATRRERSLYRSGEAILERLRKRLDKDGDGLIVLMHLGSERSDGDRPSEGLGAFMDRAVQEGWTFATAGDFVRDLGKPAWDPRQRLGVLGAAPSRGR